MWIANGQGMELKLCTYREMYQKTTNQCLPCGDTDDWTNGVFGTFQVQQAVCQSCRTMVDLYDGNLIA
jgi:hypothetical protein